jgi:hypothetical protein|tara:strand:+ start:1372 stop:1854 length:483 start_codon:yes stop_codon:yes gene_type:complete
MFKISNFLFLFLFITFQSCKKDLKTDVIETNIKFKHEGDLSILDTSNKLLKNIQIEIADNDFERQTGLMYRKEMEHNKGMLFIFDMSEVRSFYMKNTYISLDIIYIDTNNTIINIIENTKPLNDTSLLSNFPAKYVLEINAGLSKKWNIKNGDKISYNIL